MQKQARSGPRLHEQLKFLRQYAIYSHQMRSMHRPESCFLPDAIRDLAKAVRRHDLKAHGRKPAGIGCICMGFETCNMG